MPNTTTDNFWDDVTLVDHDGVEITPLFDELVAQYQVHHPGVDLDAPPTTNWTAEYAMPSRNAEPVAMPPPAVAPPSRRPRARCCDFCMAGNAPHRVERNDHSGSVYTLCSSCYESNMHRCHDCGESSVHTMGTRHGIRRICDACTPNYTFCQSCSEATPREDGEYCRRCGTGRVLEYNAHAPNIPVGDGKIHFGVELEMEVNPDTRIRDTISTIQERLSRDFSICKHDGSLNNGFEIVTRPASLAIHTAEWKKLLENRLPGVRSERTETCGFHVHCSRRYMSELQVAKIVCFTNCNANRQFMQVVAGRVADRWARMYDKKLSDGNKANEVRYEAVNLQNLDTIEFRIFKGTLKYETLMKDIEFCEALCHYSTPAKMPLSVAMDREAFIRYIHAERRYSKKLKRSVLRWPHLVAFLDAKWLGIETSLTKLYRFATVSKKEVKSIKGL